MVDRPPVEEEAPPPEATSPSVQPPQEAAPLAAPAAPPDTNKFGPRMEATKEALRDAILPPGQERRARWSVGGIALPGTPAAEDEVPIHPLTRASVDAYYSDILPDGDAYAARSYIAEALSLPPALVAAADLDTVRKWGELPKVRAMLEGATATRRAMAVDAEVAAILNKELPKMYASEMAITRMEEGFHELDDGNLADDVGIALNRSLLNFRQLLVSFDAWTEMAKLGGDVLAQKDMGQRASSLFDFEAVPGPTDTTDAVRPGLVPPAIMSWVDYALRQGAQTAGDALAGVARLINARTFGPLYERGREQTKLNLEKLVIESAMLAREANSKQYSRYVRDFLDPAQKSTGYVDYLLAARAYPGSFLAFLSAVSLEQATTIAAGGTATVLGRRISKQAGNRAGQAVVTAMTFGLEASGADPAIILKITGHDIATPSGLTAYANDLAAQGKVLEYGATRGGWIAGIELLSLGLLGKLTKVKHSKTRRFFTAAGIGVAAGSASEWVAGEATGQPATIFDIMTEGFASIGPPTLLMDMGMTAAEHAVQKRDDRRAKAWLSGQTELSGKIRGIPVEKLQTAAEVLASRFKDAGVEAIFIRASDLLTFDQDGSLVATLGLDPQEVASAAAEGNDVEIETATYVRHILGREGFEALYRKTRTDAEMLNADESEEYLANDVEGKIDEMMRSKLDAARDAFLGPHIDAAGLEKLTSDIEAIRSRVADELTATGKYSAGQVAVMSSYTARKYATNAVRRTQASGIPVDALRLYEERGLTILGGQVSRDTSFIDQAAIDFGVSSEQLRAELDAAGGDIRRTPAFTKWFGDSKVVDANGEPLVVYRGEREVVTTYDARELGKSLKTPFRKAGFFFAPQRAVAEGYAMMAGSDIVTEVYLKLENPFVLDQNTFSEVMDWGRLPTQKYKTLAAATKAADSIVQSAKDAGHDGMVIMGRDGNPAEYVAFEPTQIKSVNNRGTFDANDPRILYQRALEFGVSSEQLRAELDAAGGDIRRTPAFTKWFGDSKVVDATGLPAVMYHGTSKDTDFASFKIGQRGAWFTSAPEEASSYAVENDSSGPRFQSDGTIAEKNTASRVIPVYLAIKNPYTPTAAEMDAYRTAPSYGAAQRGLVARAKALGHDGLDMGGGTLVAFDPTQIKSVHNRGTFDANDPRILYQDATDIFTTPLPVTPTGGKKGAKVLVKDIAAAFDKDHQTKLGRQLQPEDSADDYALVKEMAVAELEMALRSKNSGVGWYAKDVEDAVQLTARLYPTLLTEPGHRNYFLFMAGIFSNGTNPTQAWEMAAGAYELFLAHPDRTIPVERRKADGSPVEMTTYKDKTGKTVTKPAGWGVRGATNNQQLAVLKYLVEQEGSLDAAVKWFLESHPRDEINRVMLESGGYKAGRYKTAVEKSGGAERGTEILGPKLGNYTASLLGIEVSDGDTTVDKWYTRTYRRWTGRLFEAPLSQEGVADQPNPARGGIERQTIFRLTGELARQFKIGPDDVQAVLWFFEKRLWANHGASLDEGTNSSGAKALLEKRGVHIDGGGDTAGSSPAGTPTTPAFEKGPAGPQGVDIVGDVIFEVAPDPNNVELSARWNALPDKARLAISDAVSKSVLPAILEAAGAAGSVLPQIGSYLADTNPSFSLRLTSGDPAAVAMAVGFVLSQDSMVALSPNAFEGSFEAGAVRIQIGDKSLQEIDGIYQTLRGIEGFPQIGGQSTTDGQMTVILEEGVDVEAFSDAVVSALPSEYSDAVLFNDVNVAFPEKKDYDYGSPENDPAGNAGVARQRYRDVRVQASREVAAAIDQYERGGPAALEQRGSGDARGGFTPDDLISDAARAAIRGQDGRLLNLVQIFELADLTTFLHESGHLWLEELKADAQEFGGEFQRDFDIVNKWWQSRSLQIREEAVRRATKAGETAAVSALQSMTDAEVKAYISLGDLRGFTSTQQRFLSVSMHEQFARGVETYFATGNAPSVSLGSVFSRFAAWVKSTYSGMKGTDVTFSPEVAGVIDRMLATDEEIALAESQYRMIPLFDDAAQMGMSLDDFAAYQKEMARRSQQHVADHNAKKAAEARRARTQWWQEERARLREPVEAELASRPLYRLLHTLATGGLANGAMPDSNENVGKMNRAVLAPFLSEAGMVYDDLPQVGNSKITAAGKDLIDPAIVAGIFGFDSVVEMLQELKGLPKFDDAVQAEMTRLMEEKHGSLNDAGQDEATATVHGDHAAKVMATELAALRTTEPAFKPAFIRAYAQSRINSLPVGDVKPYKFLVAERRSAKAAREAIRKGDKVEAYKHQFQRLVNHRLAEAAIAAEKRVEAESSYMRGIQRKGRKFRTIDPNYVDQMKAAIAIIDFDAPVGVRQRAAANVQALQDFMLEAQETDGAVFKTPAWIADKDRMTNVRKMTYGQFLETAELVHNLEKQGRLAKRMRVGQQNLDRQQQTAEMLAKLDGMPLARVNRLRKSKLFVTASNFLGGWPDAFIAFLASADANLHRVEAMLEHIDGTPLGPWHQALFQPFADSEFQKNLLTREVSVLIDEKLRELPDSVRNRLGKAVDVGALGDPDAPGVPFTRGNLIMLALNTGNESNLEKLIQGYRDVGWNIDLGLIDAAIAKLTKEEVDLVQAVWQHAEKLFPSADAIFREENGISPDRVEPRTVNTAHGDITGGYFPMLYDYSQPGGAAQAGAARRTALEIMQGRAGIASVNSSMTKGRTAYSAPVDLDITRLTEGFETTIHYITHYGAVRNARKILMDKALRPALELKVGKAYARELDNWIAAIATNGGDNPPMTPAEKAAAYVARNTTVSMLGYSYTTVVAQLFGTATALDRLTVDMGYGPINLAKASKHMARGYRLAFSSPHIAGMMAISKEMPFRIHNIDRDLKDQLKRLAKKTDKGVTDHIVEMAMQSIAAVQFYGVDVPTWMAAYNVSMEQDPTDTQRAANYADRVVRLSQSAGSIKDLAGVQRLQGYGKLFTQFYGFFSALYAILRGVASDLNRDIRTKPGRAILQATTRYMIVVVLQEMLAALTRGKLPDLSPDAEEEEGMAMYLAKSSLSAAAATVPLLGNIVRGALDGHGYTGSASSALGDMVFRATQDILKDDADRAEVKTAADKAKPYIMILGIATGKVPAVQLNRTLDGLNALYDDQPNASWPDVIRGYDPKVAGKR
jgi:hypothetical protein